MDIAPNPIKKLQLQNLPAFVVPDSEKSRLFSVFHYLHRLIARELTKPGETLELPSIASLSQYFKCSPLEVYDALRDLKQSQYEYQFSKFDHPIGIWQKPDLSRRRHV